MILGAFACARLMRTVVGVFSEVRVCFSSFNSGFRVSCFVFKDIMIGIETQYPIIEVSKFSLCQTCKFVICCRSLCARYCCFPTFAAREYPQTVVCSMPALQLIGFVWLRFKATGMFWCYVRLHVYKVMLCCQEMRSALATTTKRLFVTVVTTSLPPHFSSCRRLQRKMKWRTRLALVSYEVTFFKWFIIYKSWFKDEVVFSVLKVPCLQCYTWKNGMTLFKCLAIKY